VCHTALHCVKQCPVKGHHILFCKRLNNPHHTCRALYWFLSDLYFGLGWDDNCPGLVETLVREAEWKWGEEHNGAAAASWATKALDGWGSTPPVSPIVEG
jgi:hypothetical protein